MRPASTLPVIVAGAALSASVHASDLLIDINSVRAEIVPQGASTPSFSTNFTGDIKLSGDANSSLAHLIEFPSGVFHSYPVNPLTYFSATLELLNGKVVDGGVTVQTNGSLGPNTFDPTAETFTALFRSSGGNVSQIPAGVYHMDGLMKSNSFSHLSGPGMNLFANFDVTPWLDPQTRGAVVFFKFSPDADGVDLNADIDLHLWIPTPGTISLAGVSATLAALRRRR